MSNLVFLTGGTGFLGHHLVPLLVRAGYRVRLLARPTSNLAWLPRHGVEVFPGDITQPQSLETAMHGCCAVIHAAGLFRFWGAEETFQRVNHHGTRHVAETAAKSGVDCFVHISSIAVVGTPPPTPFDENISCHPQDAYQRSKLDGERVVRDLAESGALPAVILRPGGFYGPGSTYGFNRLFLLDPLRGLRVQVDRGRRFTFPVYIADVAQAILAALRFAPIGQIYHICDTP
ncbi:MAG: NAD-dependent epimerase/dehydratase family protein, partial [Anaerolineae bacterium]